MRIWIKATLITISIALVVLVFDAYWFVDKQEEETNPSSLPLPIKAVTDTENIKLLKDSLHLITISKNYANFALQLSSSYVKLGSYDSAAKYNELAATRFPNEENLERAGLMYFKAFEHASGEEEEQKAALKSIGILEKILNPSSSADVELALATLYIANEEPLKADTLLRKVLLKNAANTKALYLSGIQLYQHNRYQEATDYFNRLVKVDSSNINGLYYLAVCTFKTGSSSKAKVLFKKLKLLDITAELQNNIDEYLHEIK